MKHHFGILAHSAEGAALCFRTFCQAGAKEFGPHQHPDVTLDCIAMGRCMPAWEAENYHYVREVLGVSVSRLAAAGAEFFACPDNTAHIALGQAGEDLALPGLHIADVVADAALERGMTNVGILGTKWTMTHSMYPEAFSSRGIASLTPLEPQREFVNTTIFEELVEGRFTARTRAVYVEIVEDLHRRGCDGVALVCTEIPLLLDDDASPLPILDSTRLLAKAAFEVAAGHRPLPDWRGGPRSAPAGQPVR